MRNICSDHVRWLQHDGKKEFYVWWRGTYTSISHSRLFKWCIFLCVWLYAAELCVCIRVYVFVWQRKWWHILLISIWRYMSICTMFILRQTWHPICILSRTQRISLRFVLLQIVDVKHSLVPRCGGQGHRQRWTQKCNSCFKQKKCANCCICHIRCPSAPAAHAPARGLIGGRF